MRSKVRSFRPFLSASVYIGLLACLLVGLGWTTASAQSTPSAQSKPTLLAPGSRILQGVNDTEIHHYQLELEEGQCASVEVEQRGVDVSVRLLTRDNEVVVELDDQLGKRGTEQLEIIADHPGSYSIAVKPKWRAAGGAYEVRLAGVRSATEQDRSLYEVRRLRTEAKRLFVADKHEEGLPLVQRALNLAQQVLGTDDVYVAVLTREVADVNYNLARSREARAGFESALQTLTAKAGPEHPQTLYAKARLGSVYTALGEYSKADEMLRAALEGEEKTFGEDDPILAGTLKSLAFLHDSRGDFAKAEQEDLRGLAILERLGLTDQLAYGEFLNNLGVIYKDLESFDKAEVYFERSAAFEEKHYGAESLRLSQVLNNLGIVARQRKDYPAAERYFLKALAIKEKHLGASHPQYAAVLMNLGNVYAAEGDYRKALDTHLDVLAIYEKALPPGAFPPISPLANVARDYIALGEFDRANKTQAKLEAALEQDIEFNLAVGSERQKLAYLDSVAQRTARAISLNLQSEPDNLKATTLAATVLLQRKGRLLDAMTDSLAALRKHSDAEDQVLLDELKDTSTELARLSLRGPRKQTMEEYGKGLRDLQDRKEKLEDTIGHHNEEFRARSQEISFDAVQRLIPSDAALLEFAEYSPFNSKAQTDAEQNGNLRYSVYVLHRTGSPKGIDLGEAKDIDSLIEKLRSQLRDPGRADLREVARALGDKVFRPMEALLAGDKHLLISPDGQLNLIPFEALSDARGRYLIEGFSITYVTTGRDLLRMEVPRPSRSAPVLVADPLFDQPSETATASAANISSKAAAERSIRRSVTTGTDLSTLYFAPLAGTRAEAHSIHAFFPKARELTGAAASETALDQLAGPEILHIATHGFFLDDAGPESAGDRNGTTPGPPESSSDPENPLLRSGLALAGANLVKDGKANGILTALEVSNLDLWGTKLVVLSACDTGVGEVKNGEGIYGLRRSFFLAGTESLVMSLWPVSDYVTRELMVSYYGGLRRGLGRGEALRQAQLAMMKRKGRQHPFYWASFIEAGEWADLAGRR